MSHYQPRAADFAPLAASTDAEQIQRPSLSYWQDVWVRLRANTRALASLGLIIALLLFTLVGPVLWSVDPARQDLEQISQGPHLGLEASVIADFREIPQRRFRI